MCIFLIINEIIFMFYSFNALKIRVFLLILTIGRIFGK